jgi:hypothetical protein
MLSLESVAREPLDKMEANLALTLQSVISLGVFYDGSKVIARQDFRRFADTVLKRDKGVQDWNGICGFRNIGGPHSKVPPETKALPRLKSSGAPPARESS